MCTWKLCQECLPGVPPLRFVHHQVVEACVQTLCRGILISTRHLQNWGRQQVATVCCHFGHLPCQTSAPLEEKLSLESLSDEDFGRIVWAIQDRARQLPVWKLFEPRLFCSKVRLVMGCTFFQDASWDLRSERLRRPAQLGFEVVWWFLCSDRWCGTFAISQSLGSSAQDVPRVIERKCQAKWFFFAKSIQQGWSLQQASRKTQTGRRLEKNRRAYISCTFP